MRYAEASETFMPDDSGVTDASSNWGVVNILDDSHPDPSRGISKQPIQYSKSLNERFHCCCRLTGTSLAFESSGITITCTVLFAEQFDSLRRDFDCDKSILESLARCVKWDNRGGKSGSGFLKTRGEGLCL